MILSHRWLLPMAQKGLQGTAELFTLTSLVSFFRTCTQLPSQWATGEASQRPHFPFSLLNFLYAGPFIWSSLTLFTCCLDPFSLNNSLSRKSKPEALWSRKVCLISAGWMTCPLYVLPWQPTTTPTHACTLLQLPAQLSICTVKPEVLRIGTVPDWSLCLPSFRVLVQEKCLINVFWTNKIKWVAITAETASEFSRTLWLTLEEPKVEIKRVL